MAIKIYEVNPRYIDFLIPHAPHLFRNKQPGQQYRKLLMAEYRIIRKLQDKIMKNAAEVYKHKIKKGTTTALARRCNNFRLLEEESKKFKSKSC